MFKNDLATNVQIWPLPDTNVFVSNSSLSRIITASIFTKIGTLKFLFGSKYMKICNSIINTICRNQSSHISSRYQWQLLPFKVAFTRANLGVRSSRIWQTANPHLSAGYLKVEKQDEKWLMIMGRRMCWKG